MKKLIVIEGPIGVGKTSFAKLLAGRFKYEPVLEEPSSNPFLKRFYDNIERYSFQTQLYFLLSRSRKLEGFRKAEGSVISDFLFEKDRIFAKMNLNDDEFALYNQFYNMLLPSPPLPDLLIYLQAKPEVLINRIKKRGISYENNISLGYLKKLVDNLNNFVFNYSESPLLVINTSDIDFVESPEDLDNLEKVIRSVKKGTQYYIPLGSR